jgi:hypothetical protein
MSILYDGLSWSQTICRRVFPCPDGWDEFRHPTAMAEWLPAKDQIYLKEQDGLDPPGCDQKPR